MSGKMQNLNISTAQDVMELLYIINRIKDNQSNYKIQKLNNIYDEDTMFTKKLENMINFLYYNGDDSTRESLEHLGDFFNNIMEAKGHINYFIKDNQRSNSFENASYSQNKKRFRNIYYDQIDNTFLDTQYNKAKKPFKSMYNNKMNNESKNISNEEKKNIFENTSDYKENNLYKNITYQGKSLRKQGEGVFDKVLYFLKSLNDD